MASTQRSEARRRRSAKRNRCTRASSPSRLTSIIVAQAAASKTFAEDHTVIKATHALLLAMLLPMSSAWAVDASEHSVRVTIDGLVCEICAGKVRGTIEALDGAFDVHVDLDAKLVTLRIAAGHELPVRDLERRLLEQGFVLRQVTITPNDAMK
jgi:copper chaperone CopZ